MNQEILVKCLSSEDKDVVCDLYTQKRANLKKIAEVYGVSPRTIARVLEERGLATPVPRLKGEAHQVMGILKEFNIEVQDLRKVLGHCTQFNARQPEKFDLVQQVNRQLSFLNNNIIR